MHLQSLHTFPNHVLRKESNKQLMYGYESALDRSIATNEILLTRYFEELDFVVRNLNSPQVIEQIVNNISNKILPYIDDLDIQKSGLLDKEQRIYDREYLSLSLIEKQNIITSRLQNISRDIKDIRENKNISNRVARISKVRNFFMKTDMKLLRFFTNKNDK